MKDREILERISRGDERVLDYMYQKNFRMMANMVLKNSGTEDDAKDVYQEALIVFWRKAASGSLVLTSKISTYLYSICLNQWRKELDRRSRLSREEKDGTAYQTHEENQNYEIIVGCIETLGDPCKSILMYHYFDGLSMTDIAEKMNFANTDTAKTKKYKCKKRLDALVKQQYERGDFFN
ncbi:MAG: RNA polymerase sigma factor (sigma-70 family) [Cyclobacteriaceae bacterium]|jgi:RNA polymerase sigma factor (sigma-70 family)